MITLDNLKDESQFTVNALKQFRNNIESFVSARLICSC